MFGRIGTRGSCDRYRLEGHDERRNFSKGTARGDGIDGAIPVVVGQDESRSMNTG